MGRGDPPVGAVRPGFGQRSDGWVAILRMVDEPGWLGGGHRV